jgi:Amt family ammonium transporter
LGTGLLWFGWYGFNGGSALKADTLAIYACVNTTIGAAGGSISWVLGYFFKKYLKSRNSHKMDKINYPKILKLFCFGIICGLISITSGCSVVSPIGALGISIVSSLCSFLMSIICKKYLIQDELDVFACHGISGMMGELLLPFFV